MKVSRALANNNIKLHRQRERETIVNDQETNPNFSGTSREYSIITSIEKMKTYLLVIHVGDGHASGFKIIGVLESYV